MCVYQIDWYSSVSIGDQMSIQNMALKNHEEIGDQILLGTSNENSHRTNLIFWIKWVNNSIYL